MRYIILESHLNENFDSSGSVEGGSKTGVQSLAEESRWIQSVDG